MDRRRSSSSSLSSPAVSSDEEELGRSSSGEEDEDESLGGGSGATWESGPISLGVEEDDEDDEDEDDEDDDSDFPSVHRSPPPTITWPPAVADNSNRPEATGVKRKKPGIIYLSSIPQGFNVSRTTGFFSQYGRVGRVFLQPDGKDSKTRGGKVKAQKEEKLTVPRNYTEGWIEFMSKRLAKEVATNLNLTQVGGKKRSKAHDIIWNIKYLPGFKWNHLSERLAYEKAVHQQRMRSEISQAKKESDYFKSNVEKSKRLKRTGSKGSPPPPAKKRAYEFRQKETDEAIKSRKKTNTEESGASSSTKKRKSSVAESEVSPPVRKRRPSGAQKKSPEKTKKSAKVTKKQKVPQKNKAGKDVKKSKAKSSPKKSDRAELLKALI